jgi:hypothetical protein
VAGGISLSITGQDKVKAKLRARTLTGRSHFDVRVAYTAPYAVYVHEDLTKAHPNGQAKFLEQPMRELRGPMQDIIKRRLKSKRSLEDAITPAAKMLFARSQELVPVLSGFLKASGYWAIA